MRILAKEFHQLKWMLISGCIAGLSFPVIEYSLMNRPGQHETNSGAGVVLFAGAFFGILLAAAATWHDARKGAPDFIQARPFNCSRIFVTKTLLAAIFLPLAMLLVSFIDLVTNSGSNQEVGFSIVLLTWPVALMLFALTMFLVVITQDPAKSVIIAVWVGILVYSLPAMFNGVEWLSLFWLLANNRGSIFAILSQSYSRLLGKAESVSGLHWNVAFPYLCFLGTMLIATAGFTWLATKAMKNRWHWQPGQKTMVWIIGITTAIIFGQVMLQVGQNLQPLKETSGKPIVSPARFIDEDTFSRKGHRFTTYEDAICCNDDLMFLVGKEGRHITSDDPRQNKFVLYAYRFPWPESARPVPDGTGRHTTFLAGKLALFTLPPNEADWVGPEVAGCVMKDNLLYAFYIVNDSNEHARWQTGSIHLAVIDVSDPSAMLLLREEVIGDSKTFDCGFAVSGDHCYIDAGTGIEVVSLETPGKPQVVNKAPTVNNSLQIPRTTYYPTTSSFSNVTASTYWLQISGDILIANNAPYGFVLFDISESCQPKIVAQPSYPSFLSRYDRIEALLYDSGYMYIATRGVLYVTRLERDASGRASLSLVGYRRATPLEKLAERRPRQLILYKGYLAENAGPFGLILYDIRDPQRPRRAFHASPSGIQLVGIWRGLLYTQSWLREITFFDLPKAP